VEYLGWFLFAFPLWPGMACILLAVWTSSFEKVLYSSVAHFFIGSLIFGKFRFLNSLYILVISPLADV
jgi:type IV secretory pathway TrbL component